MLLSLKIENYALIRFCDVSFQSGFTSVTGETGAGKSIMLGALALVLGGRADSRILLDKEKKCVVEAVFSVGENMKTIFDDNDLDFDKQSVFRREITPSGKSRAFINDTPVQLSVMKLFSNFLVDIHSQSSTVNLKNHDFQLAIIDSLLEDRKPLQSYQEEYKLYKETDKIIRELQIKQSEFIKEKSYNEFLFEELENADLQDGEQDEKERMLELATNAETIKENIVQSLQILDNEQDNNILGLFNETSYKLGRIASHNKHLSELYNRMESATIELKDIYNELSSFNDGLDFDEGQMNMLSDRLNLIYTLQKKHNATSVAELIDIKNNLQEKLLQSDNIDSEIEKYTTIRNQQISHLNSLSDEIHNLRLQASEKLCEQIKPLLASMSMKDAVLKVEIIEYDNFNADGKDKTVFLFNANKTKDNRLQELSSVISGGELSRLMLAIKAVTAKKYSVGTMVFDEIDTGISGDIASKAADIMKMISSNHQVIVITHLVQMAAKSEHQYKVFKKTENNQTESNIEELDTTQRIEELAKMLSGDSVTKEALANAKTLLNV